MLTRKNYDILDVTKIILSILIVCIHTELLPDICYPILRMAVPLFFIISSYLFFSKVKMAETETEQNGMLKQYLLRNGKLYLFYFILTLPITIMKRKWYVYGAMSIMMFLRSLLFGSTFVASWYIVASMIGTATVFFLSRKLNSWVITGIGVVSYMVGCIASNYYYLFYNITAFQSAMDQFEIIFPSAYASFFVSILWIQIGKIFAEHNFSAYNKNVKWILLFSLMLLYAERAIIMHFQFARENDCYLMLIPVCSSIFLLLMQFPIQNVSSAKTLRACSIMIYALHGSLLPIIRKLIEWWQFNDTVSSYILFIITIILCLIYCLAVLKLEKYEHLQWLKYAH